MTLALAPAFSTLVIFVAWCYHRAGYEANQWAPGGLMVLGLLALSVWVLGRKVTEIPLRIRLALGQLWHIYGVQLSVCVVGECAGRGV